MRLVGLILLSSALLLGCAAKPVVRPLTSESSKAIVVKAIATNNKGREIELLPYAGKLTAWFPVVQGSIFGNPTDAAVYSVPVILGEDFVLDLRQLESAARPYASSLTGEMLNPTIRSEPSSMKLARIGTFFYDLDRSKIVSGAAFLDDASRDFFVLIYSDRPGIIRGHFRLGPDTVDADLEIQEPGLSWLRATKVEQGYRLRVSRGAERLLLGTMGVQE